MTPAEELTAAADRLDAAASAATPGDWNNGETVSGWAAIYGGPRDEHGYRTRLVYEFKDEADCEECVRPSTADASYIAAMNPTVGKALAGWLLSHADWAAEHQDHGLDCSYFDAETDFGLDVARAINGTTS